MTPSAKFDWLVKGVEGPPSSAAACSVARFCRVCRPADRDRGGSLSRGVTDRVRAAAPDRVILRRDHQMLGSSMVNDASTSRSFVARCALCWAERRGKTTLTNILPDSIGRMAAK